jgi:amino acid transporter
MFGRPWWQWLAATVGFGFIAALRIPGISLIADLLSVLTGLVLILIILRAVFMFYFGGSGGSSTNDVSGHDRALRHRYKDF